MPEQDAWTTESGLLDDFDLVVTETWFGDDEENDDERIFLFLRGEAFQEGELVEEEYRERYSCGKNWDPIDDGAAVENSTGRNRFNRNSGVGRLIDALVDPEGVDAAALLKERGQPSKAATFNKLTIHFEREVVSRWTNDDGEHLTWELPLPTSVEATPKKKGKGKSSKKADSRSKKKNSLRADVIDFATEFDVDEHDKFVDQVLDPDVFTNAELIEADPELHAEVLTDGSKLWKKAHKG